MDRQVLVDRIAALSSIGNQLKENWIANQGAIQECQNILALMDEKMKEELIVKNVPA